MLSRLRSGFCQILCLGLLGLVAPVLAQTPQPNSVAVSPWQAVARYNTQKPLRIKLINRTEFPLEYGLTDPRRDVFEMPAGATVELTGIRIPNCLAINTPMLSPVRYIVNVKGNLATVEVKLVDDLSGDHCIDLNKNGAIYVY